VRESKCFGAANGRFGQRDAHLQRVMSNAAELDRRISRNNNQRAVKNPSLEGHLLRDRERRGGGKSAVNSVPFGKDSGKIEGDKGAWRRHTVTGTKCNYGVEK